MVGSLLIRGMLVGILAGILAFGVAKVFGEPQVDQAIAFEAQSEAHDAAAPAGHSHGGDAEAEPVSRQVQSTIGLFTGVVVFGASIGGIFSLAFAYAHGRIGRFGPRSTAALLAAAGFVTLTLLPQLIYPANPPSVGNPDTIGFRTALYFIAIALSVLAGIAALGTGRALAARLGTWNASLVGIAAYLVVMIAASIVLPAVNEVPEGFSAVLLWKFRLASFGISLTMWTVLGLGFGVVAERILAPRQLPAFRSARA